MIMSHRRPSSLVISRWSFTIDHWLFLLILIAYLALAVSYSLASPIYEPTDELGHFRYVRHLIVYRSLPVQPLDDPRAPTHHPPLYYSLGALVSGWVPVVQEVYYQPLKNPFWAYRYWEVSDDNKNQYIHGDDERFPFHGVTLAVYVVRWMTVLIGAGIVWLTYRIGRKVFTDQPALAVSGAALIAFNPQFIYLSGSINNDIVAGLCGAAVLLVCVRLVREGPSVRTDVTMGILYGVALLAKFHLLVLLALIELAYVLAVWQKRDGSTARLSASTELGEVSPKSEIGKVWRALLRGNLIVLGLAALISGWWFWRNWVLYGEPTGFQRVTELWGVRNPLESWGMLIQELPYAWSSLWGRFGYGQVPLPGGVYQVLAWLAVAGLVGLLLMIGRLLRQRIQSGVRDSQSAIRNSQLLLLLVDVLLFIAVLFGYILVSPAGAMGRFLFPALSAFALLLVLGLSQFVPPRLTWAVSLVVTLGMAVLAVYALVGILAPAFARPRPLTKSEITSVPNPTDVEFGPSTGSGRSGIARLLGYQVTPTTVEPGGVVEVTLYWQTLARTDQNYVVFVHLLSEVGTMAAQRDTYPGLGRYPTTAWEPGVAFADTYRVHVAETAYTPDSGYVQVGMYLPDGPRLTTPDGRDALRLATVQIVPQPGEVPNPLNVNFGDRFALVGYTLDRRVARPGETIRLTLYWQASVPIEMDYKCFVNILGVENQVWARSDGQLADGTALTSHWEPGRIVEDVRDLTVGLTTPPNFYDIEVGLYAPGIGGDRLPVIAEDRNWLGNRVLLNKIRVMRIVNEGNGQVDE